MTERQSLNIDERFQAIDSLLERVEGQVRAIQVMVVEGCSRVDLVRRTAAVRADLKQVTGMAIDLDARRSLTDLLDKNPDWRGNIEPLLRTLNDYRALSQ